MGMRGQCYAPAALPRGERDPVHAVQEAGWTPGLIWMGGENLVLPGIRSPDRQAVASRYTD
jgi:hypothetical protein